MTSEVKELVENLEQQQAERWLSLTFISEEMEKGRCPDSKVTAENIDLILENQESDKECMKFATREVNN